ncbi:hypothetical protein HNQ59_004012 [Chitinivorax tropicus]|uniref:Uncharacterized protein n=1 Tax=Chitinivorax tropicus TaxID=714531 RepID=A0A840MTW3_9PROT|nr:hypothetical protein [Chitinivorax tropicus]MBB5020687.1 hypothetical protein [Chitinivorax tropicus]
MNIGDSLDLNGWLVIIDYRLFVIPYIYSDKYEMDEKIEISRPEIIFAVLDKILPLAGGKSFIFHEVKASGVLIGIDPVLIEINILFVKERGGDFVAIDVNGLELDKYKCDYEKFVNGGVGVKSNDWLDFCR